MSFIIWQKGCQSWIFILFWVVWASSTLLSSTILTCSACWKLYVQNTAEYSPTLWRCPGPCWGSPRWCSPPRAACGAPPACSRLVKLSLTMLRSQYCAWLPLDNNPQGKLFVTYLLSERRLKSGFRTSSNIASMSACSSSDPASGLSSAPPSSRQPRNRYI